MENCKAPEIRQDFTKLHIYVGIKRERERETRLSISRRVNYFLLLEVFDIVCERRLGWAAGSQHSCLAWLYLNTLN